MTFGELFAGIGGFSLGLERAGMTCKWQVEIDPYATAVLRKHWPDVPKHDDVRTFPPTHDDYSVDLICGGFPCQDISVAGKGAGLAGERSGLWNDLLGSFAQFGHDGWSSKTSQLSLLEGSEPFSETWPKSGLMRNGTAYRLQPLVRRIDGNASGLWPTPVANQQAAASIPALLNEAKRLHLRGQCPLATQVAAEHVTGHRMWPSPTATSRPREGSVRMCRAKFVAGEATLEEASAIAGRDIRDAQGKVPAMYPTPTHMGHHSGGRMNEWGGSGSRSKLKQMVQDGSLTLQEINGSLNPTWVEWLMGFPLGWTALDASATPSSRKSSKSSGGRSLTRRQG